MKIVVRANAAQKELFMQKNIPAGADIKWLDENDLIEETNADFYFDFLYDANHTGANLFVKGKLVFANAVVSTTDDIKYANYVRFNGWNSFFERSVLEIATSIEGIKPLAEEALNFLGWQFSWAPDEPGMIAPRVIAMIINEAYFGLGENISTKAEIDIAMKLGTNYPYGPFEWAEKIGVRYIYALLKKLEGSDARYAPAPLLEAEAIKS